MNSAIDKLAALEADIHRVEVRIAALRMEVRWWSRPSVSGAEAIITRAQRSIDLRTAELADLRRERVELKIKIDRMRSIVASRYRLTEAGERYLNERGER